MVPDTDITPQFAVVTDSTADIDPATAAERGIVVVPLAVTIDGETLPDGAITQAEFFSRMAAAPALPTTSQPSVGAFAEVYGRALESARSVISVHISEKLSGTIESARAAAEEFAGKVHVFDSRNLSWGLAWQVVEAANAAREGLSATDTLERLARTRDRVKLIVGLDSLENLRKGGRIGAVSSLMGSLLNLKVTLTVDAEGAFAPLGRSRGEKAALEYTLDWIGTQMGSARRGKFAVGHAFAPERGLRLVESIKERWEVTELVIYEAGSVICAHTGTGWGVAFLPED
ncbi:MAG TPA: DegV family protein [Coriobacteriia bacterium]|nr:DegV family protein [Coriobacteriia bacterium]